MLTDAFTLPFTSDETNFIHSKYLFLINTACLINRQSLQKLRAWPGKNRIYGRYEKLVENAEINHSA